MNWISEDTMVSIHVYEMQDVVTNKSSFHIEERRRLLPSSPLREVSTLRLSSIEFAELKKMLRRFK